MFFKKNKPEKPKASGQQAGTPFEASDQVSASFSLFAPALNPAIAPIDFGFDSIPAPPPSYTVPAPPPDSMSYPQSVQSQWSDNQASASEDFMTPSPSSENWASPQETSAQGWENAAAPSLGMNVSTPSSSPQNPTYLNETFENYVPQSSSDTTAAWSAPAPLAETTDSSLFQFEHVAPFETRDFQQEIPPFVQSDPIGQSFQSEPLASSVDLTAAFESSISYGPESTTGNAMGELMPWEQSVPVPENTALFDSPEALWQNLDSSDPLPGEQVPMAPGAMMDTLHQKIYPDDPFHTDPAEFLEGQQAFEDAAQFLFPDTMKAPLNWQEEATDPIHYNQPAELPYLTENTFESAPMDLGPSIQSSSSSFNEMTSLYPEEVQPSAPQEVTSYLPADDSFDFSLNSSVDAFSSVEEELLLPELEWPPFESLESAEGDFTAFASHNALPEAEQGAFQSVEPTTDLYDEPFGQNGLEMPTLEHFSQALPPLFDGDETVYTPFVSEAPTSDAAPIDLMGLMAADDEYESEISFQTSMSSDPSGEFTMGGLENLESLQVEPVVVPQMLSDQDFYATDFTLNEYGELIPASSDEDDDSLLANSALGFDALQPPQEFVPESVSPVSAEPDDRGFSLIEPVQQPDLLAVDFWETSSPMDLEAIPAPELLPETLQPPQEFVPESVPSVSAEPGDMGFPVIEAVQQPDLLAGDFWETSSPMDLEAIPAPELLPETLQPPQEFVPESVPSVSAEPGDVGFPAIVAVQQPDLLAGDFWELTPPTDLEIMPARVDNEAALFPAPQQFAIPEAPSVMASSFLKETSEDFTELTPASPFAEIALPPVLAAHPPEPLEEDPMAQLTESISIPPSAPPIQQPEYSPTPLEAQWESEPAADSQNLIQSSPVTSSNTFSMVNLQVLGTCSLAADRRLLLVSSEGVFALMGQVGLEQPQISVLKIFENNPLAYQNTFTAVAEAQAATQGMFVTQVGTWHAIVSTYQDKITLHTELG